MLLPDTWSAGLHLGEVPIAAILMAILSCALIVHQLSTPGDLSFGVVAGTAALVAMMALGCFRGNIETFSLKFFMADIYSFTGLLLGYAVVRERGVEGSLQTASQIAVIASITVVTGYLGIFSGLITPMFAENSGRLVTLSIFEATVVLLIILPMASVAQSGKSTSLMLLIACAATLLSGTRSMLILTVLTGVICLILRPRRVDIRFVMQLTGGVALTVAVYIFSLARFNSNVFQRLASSQGSSESRIIELLLFWGQISDDLTIGQGMGSRFATNVFAGAGGDPLASAPHIGIVTLLMKGGIGAFLAFIVLPLFIAVIVSLSKSQSRLRRAGAGSVLLYLALACQSGGWDPLYLFIYGMAISVTVNGARRHVLRSLASGRNADSHLHDAFSPLEER
jgi:hypothetical protein